VEEMWTHFKHVVELLVNEHVPLKKEEHSRKKHWITKATIKQIKERNKLWRNYRQMRIPIGRGY